MSKGILISRSTKIKLGKKCFTHPSMANSNFFKNYRNMYNVVIRLAKKLYYERELKAAQSNLKKPGPSSKMQLTSQQQNLQISNLLILTVLQKMILKNFPTSLIYFFRVLQLK